MANDPVSVNFDFLKSCDEQLVVYAAGAERYVFDDPNTSLIKTRQFSEHLSRHVAARLGLDPTEMDFVGVIEMVRRNRAAPKHIGDYFDLMRLRGNEAVHEGKGDRSSALRTLATAHFVARWFYIEHLDGAADLPPFQPPPRPADASEALALEVSQLREEAARYRQELEQTKGQQQELSAVIINLERESAERYESLARHQQKLADAERRFLSEKLQMDARLQKLAAEARQQSPATLKSFIDRSREAAKRTGLRGDSAEVIPLSRIRFSTNDSCWRCKVDLVLVQSMGGGFVSQNCPKCNKSKALSSDAFSTLDVYIACPKCKTKMAKAIIRKNYGFTCQTCDYHCLLASLLPRYSEL